MWQDIIFTIVNIVFSISLIPQVYYGFKHKTGPIKYGTSIPTFIGLYVIAFTYSTLSFWFSVISALFAGTLWFLLFLQRYMYGEK